MQYISIYKDTTGQLMALYTGKDGNAYTICSQKPFATAGMQFKNHFNKRTLKLHFKNKFYWIRRSIIQNSCSDKSLKINNISLFDDGEPLRDNIESLNKNLHWHIQQKEDIRDNFIEHLHLYMPHSDNESLEYDAFCPVDGPVNVIIGELKSPAWTWRSLCGRCYELILCPRCLGLFSLYLTKMS